MNLYQAGYTRRGKQGEGAGWSIVCPSEDMSQAAREGFGGFAGNLAELVNGNVMPKEAFGIFRHDRFLYYLHINYEAGGQEDARGVSFTHGYCFNLADYYELGREPGRILGIKEGTFRKEYDPSVKALPTVHELPWEDFDYKALTEKYGLTGESYRRLLIGATCALEGFADALCVRLSCPPEEHGQACREIMYLIMRGLPYHLRTGLTFFSWKGGKTSVYFSDEVEGNNYFDLESKEYACDKSRLERYQFTRVYNVDDGTRQKLLEAMAGFIDEAFDIPLKEIGCNQIEHAFQSQLKNVLGKAIDQNLAIPLLSSFLGYPVKEGSAAEEYLAALLESISENHLQIKDSGLLGRVVNRARHSANRALRRSFLVFYAGQILAMEEQKGYSLLLRLYREDRKLYDALTDTIEQMDEAYFRYYLEEVFLPARLKNLDMVISYLEEGGRVAGSEEVFDSLILEAATGEMKAAVGFEEQLQVRDKAWEAADLMAETRLKDSREYALCADYLLWKYFDISQFSAQDIERYKRCSLNELARNGFNGKKCRTARNVVNLISVATDFRPSSEQLYRLFFTDELFKELAVKKVAQNLLRKGAFQECRLEDGHEMDLSLLCYYELEEDRLEAARWVRQIIRMGCGDLFEPGVFPQMAEDSFLLEDMEIRRQVMRSLETGLEERAWRIGDEDDREVKAAMELCLACLSGEEPESGEADGEWGFRFCLHKLAVGHLAVVAIGAFAWCLWKYADMGALALGVSAVAGAGGAIALGIRIYLEGSWREYLRGLGIESPRKLLTAAGCEALLVLSTIGLWAIVRWLPALQEAARGNEKTIAAAAGCGVFALIAIAGAAAMTSGDYGDV